MNNSAADRIWVIERSRLIFKCGLLALLPIIGLLLAVRALVAAFSTTPGEVWNPAAAQMRWGMGLAFFSLAYHVLGAFVVIAGLVH